MRERRWPRSEASYAPRLGAWPWTLQLPGILLVLFVSGETHFWWRVAGMLLIQLALWYGTFALVGRMRPTRHV